MATKIYEYTKKDFDKFPELECLKNYAEEVVKKLQMGFPLKRINGYYVETQEILDGFFFVMLEIGFTEEKTTRFTYITNEEFPVENPYMMVSTETRPAVSQQHVWNSLPLI